ncbi:DUF1800 domain-containing protein [Corallococcus terminator]|uniref:DUF1800 family protein n=1 Tax=Corallococcus terminator TaxID=2316733 RepID=A0A3A8IZ50_9BACT|nr:DUF1800 family protein [Corallococcus terminator]RKG88799.1 DUF1800 family protein [Corallococcus terminator]
MLRRTALAVALCAVSCTGADGPPEQSPPAEQVLGEAQQAVDSNETPGEANSIRFLEQSSFGPRLARTATTPPVGTVEHVMAVGIPTSLTEQFALQPAAQFSGADTAPDLGAQFFLRAVAGEDQLRLRVAFALSQIMVASQLGIPESTRTAYSDPKTAMAGYMNLLSSHAFGNFRDLMEAVTKSPAMGRYLDMVNNRAFNGAGNPIDPNENYAREMLQLFTLGLHKLNMNGTVQYDTVTGEPKPAYTEAQVQAFASTLSGWTYKAAACPAKGGTITTPDYTQPMMACDVNHDKGSKQLLRNFSTTANATAQVHLTEALDNVFNDPNVPPFISKQLIQHLVTSNPTPAYVKRVATVFAKEGDRGNLKEVVRAILEDTEARGAQPPQTLRPGFGHLRSPALFITNTVRWLEPTLDLNKDPGNRLSTWSKSLGQWVTRSPSVFSYYPPNAPAPDTDGLLGPEFAILDTATVTARANFVHEFLYSGMAANSGITVDYNLVPSDATALVDWLGQYWLHGTMDPALRTRLLSALADPNAGPVLRRKKLALYLTSLSPSFQVQR